MSRLTNVAVEVIIMARLASEGYESLYDASLSPSNTGADPMPMGRSGFHVSDPTGDVVASGMHARMRYQARRVSTKLHTAMMSVEEAERIIGTAFNETDPDFADKLRRLREMEREARGLGR